MSKHPPASIEITIQDPDWKALGRGLPARIARAGSRTLAHEKAKGSLTILLTGDAQLKSLNHQFRGKNKPTNVLSFPAVESSNGYLGDVAIALGTVLREARKAAKNPTDHAVHLAVHGVLHLLGRDHEKPREAAAMERLETEILAEFGIGNPYARRRTFGPRKAAKRHG